MTDSHWKVYKCPFSCDATFTSSFDCKKHIISEHPDMASLSHMDNLVGLGVQRIDSSSGLSCPLCPEKFGSIKQYQRHVGRHQEQLALFALPNLDFNDEQSDDYDGGGSNEQVGHNSIRSGNWGSISSSHPSPESVMSIDYDKSSNDNGNEDLNKESTLSDEKEESFLGAVGSQGSALLKFLEKARKK